MLRWNIVKNGDSKEYEISCDYQILFLFTFIACLTDSALCVTIWRQQLQGTPLV